MEYNEAIELEYIHTDEGRVRISGTDLHYDYYLKDHLGNTRVSFTESTTTPNLAEALQVDNYYPFGMRFNQAPILQVEENNYLYNGKELQKNYGLGWYFYGARYYSPADPTFTTIDTKAEIYAFQNPYAYAANNPIRYIDVNGENPGNPYAYRSWTMNNPMSAIAEGFRQMFDAAASLFTVTAGVKVTNKTSLSKVKSGKTTVSSSRVTTTKSEVIFDFSKVFDYNGQNTVNSSQMEVVKTETSTTSKTVVEAETTVVVDGVPVNVSNTQTANDDGSSSNSTEVSVGISSENVDANAYVNTSTSTGTDGTKSSSNAAGVQVNVTVTTKDNNTKTQVGAYVEVENKNK